MSQYTRLHQPATQALVLENPEQCQQVTHIQSVETLLSNDMRQALLANIKKKFNASSTAHTDDTSNAPQNVYDTFCEPLIKTVANFYQELPGIHRPFNRYGGLLDQALHRVEAILEERLNHRFPEEGPDEQVAQEYVQWTFMLFTVALMRDIGKLHNCYYVSLCDAAGLWPKGLPPRWLPYDGPMSHHSQYYRFSKIDLDRAKLDPSQWDKRAGPNLAYKLMASDAFNWIHGNAAAYRVWWYELGDEEEEGRGGKGTKNGMLKADAASAQAGVAAATAAGAESYIASAQEGSENRAKSSVRMRR